MPFLLELNPTTKPHDETCPYCKNKADVQFAEEFGLFEVDSMIVKKFYWECRECFRHFVTQLIIQNN